MSVREDSAKCRFVRRSLAPQGSFLTGDSKGDFVDRIYGSMVLLWVESGRFCRPGLRGAQAAAIHTVTDVIARGGYPARQEGEANVLY